MSCILKSQHIIAYNQHDQSNLYTINRSLRQSSQDLDAPYFFQYSSLISLGLVDEEDRVWIYLAEVDSQCSLDS
ncbi:hypothetical protein CVT25_011757 [Psilocybe cyanescens]|uniref:Uncharacterized protein n=1 Tax=Psilocybe cyanescens TaxID=93625 RepID=A0A409WIH6_PSICY|nr:hypothetical protein CVT25_011757 [Psilocybe cyanescens]